MATFGDLSRVMEDTIRVDMKKRWTPQEVKFINNKNEYYGTFHGKINSIGAFLSDVELSNATFYNEKGEAVDINKLLDMDGRLIDVEYGLDSLSSVVINDVPQWIEEKVKEATSDLSVETECRISADLALCALINSRIDNEVLPLVSKISSDLSTEVEDRKVADKNICDLVLSVDQDINDRIDDEVETLNDRIDQEVDDLNSRIDQEIEDLSAETARQIFEDKHYEIYDVPTADKNYMIKDFSLNILKDSLAEGEVFFNSKIGKIENVGKSSDGQISSIDFITLNDFQDKEVEHCFPPYSTRYVLNEANGFTQEAFGGYYIKFNRNSTVLSSCTIDLERNSAGGCKVMDGNTQVGTVLNDVYEGGVLKSGKLELVPGKSSKLSAFNGIQFTFDDANQDYYFEGPATGLSSRIHVTPALKNVHLKQNFRIANIVPLRNQLSSSIEFGCLDEGSVSETSVIVKITKNIDEALTGTYLLNEENGFKVDINKDYSLDYLSADQKFRVYQNHKIYKYDLSTVVSGDVEATGAFVTPIMENRIIGEAEFDSIKFTFSATELPDFSGGEITLNRDEGFEKTISNANASATITFNVESNTVTVSETFTRGGGFFKEYFLSTSSYTLVEPTYRTDVAITQVIDIANPVFESVESDPDLECDLSISEHKDGSSDKKTLTISTENNGTITLEFPSNEFQKEVSQEFIIKMFITTRDGVKRFIPVKLANGVKVEYGTKNELYIQTNDPAIFLFRQLRNESGFQNYLVEDLKYHDMEHFIEELHQEVQTRKEGDSFLSSKIDANTECINDIYNRLSGIVNYQGILNVSTDYVTVGIQSGFTQMFIDNGFNPNDGLSSGWFWLIDSTVEPVDNHKIDGVKIGKDDYLKVDASVLVSGLKKENVIVMDNLDSDVVHYDCLKTLSTYLSDDIKVERSRIDYLSGYTNDNFFHLTGNNEISGTEVIEGGLYANALCSLTADILEATVSNLTVTGTLRAKDYEAEVVVEKLYADKGFIDNLSANLTATYFRDVLSTASDICSYIQTQINNNDTDIENLNLSVGDLSGLLKSTITSCDTLNGRVDELCVAISTDIDVNRTNISTLSGDYHKFADNTFQEPTVPHVKSYNMILTDELHKAEPDVHDQYYMTFKDGTIVLIKKSI